MRPLNHYAALHAPERWPIGSAERSSQAMGDANRLVDQKGTALVQAALAELHCLYRPILVHDKGVDGELELPGAMSATGHVAVQIKSRSQCRLRKDGTLTLTVQDRQVAYWREYGRPVVLLLYDDSTGQIHWTRVDNTRHRTIRIPHSQTVSAATLVEFATITRDYYHNLVLEYPLEDVAGVLADLGANLREIARSVASQLVSANALFARRHFDEAAGIYRAVVRLFPSSKSAALNLAKSLRCAGKLREPYKLVRGLIKSYPSWPPPHLALALMLGETGRYDEADGAIAHAILLGGETSDALNSRGLLAYWRGDGVSASTDFGRSAELDSGAPEPMYNAALAETIQGHYEAAMKLYDACVRVRTGHYDALNNKGLLLRQLWRLDEALESFARAIESDDRRVEAWYNRADLLKDLGRNEEAASDFEQAAALRPSDPHAQLALGLLYVRLGQIPDAESCFARSGELFGNAGPVLDLGFVGATYVAFSKKSPRLISRYRWDPEPALFKWIPIDVLQQLARSGAYLLPSPKTWWSDGLTVRKRVGSEMEPDVPPDFIEHDGGCDAQMLEETKKLKLGYMFSVVEWTWETMGRL
jgi:tetratricopeptide (TPR) repeat protein